MERNIFDKKPGPMNINKYCILNKINTVNLHLGCGGVRLEGWINIDNYDYEEHDTSRGGADYDIKMDIRKLDVLDDTVDRILLVHTVEHFVRWEMVEMLTHYFAKLKRGGELIVEMPDLDKCIEWYLMGKKAKHMETPLGMLNMGFTQFYGNQWSKLDYETHRYVWTKGEFKQVLEEIGFSIEVITNDISSHEIGRDMHVVAKK